MARQDFTVTLQDTCKLYYACGDHFRQQAQVTAAMSTETAVGVQRRKPTGFMFPTAYSFEKVRVDYQKGTCQYYSGVGSSHSSGQYYSGVVGAPSGQLGRFNGDSHFDEALTVPFAKDDLGLRNSALIAARNKLKGTSINLGVALGERNQTARLLGDTASNIARSVRALKRGEIRKAMNALGISNTRRQPRGANVPQKWLELQYGWKPLLSDVYGAAQALEKRPKGDWRVTVRVTRSRNDDYTNTIIPVQGNGFGGGTCKAKCMRSVFVRLDALPQNEATISLASLGVTNPLSVAWELVPWSFAIDWVLPIGSYLESLDALLGYGDACYSSSLFVKATWTDRGLSGTNGVWKNLNNYTGRRRLVYLSRIVSNSVPLPSLPRIKDPRSLGHMANGLALMATAFGRR